MFRYVEFTMIWTLILTTIPSASATVVSWPSSQGGNGHIYESVLVIGGITWSDAQGAAEAAGGHLATITSEAENNFIFDQLANDPAMWNLDYGPWLGAFQLSGSPEPAGGWSWVTGESWNYTNWFAGEPSNTNGNESHLQFIAEDQTGIPSPFWNDFADTTISQSYIVEYVPEPSTVLLFMLGTGSVLARRRRT